jgi:two-component system, cell cycle sensor histidine kinase and response regulator CckA
MSEKFTILLVDDNDEVRLALGSVLTRSFNLLAAAGSAEAVKIITDWQIDLLLTDIVMPGMNGFDLADLAVALRPGLRVLYMSGYTDLARAPRMRHGKLIPKPFHPAQLVSEIESALAA